MKTAKVITNISDKLCALHMSSYRYQGASYDIQRRRKKRSKGFVHLDYTYSRRGLVS